MLTDDITAVSADRIDILETLSAHRGFLRQTVSGLTDAEAGLRPTVSELCLGGLIKHVAATEAGWADFILSGPVGMGPSNEAAFAARAAGFRIEPGETLAGLLEQYEQVARRTDDLVRSLPSLDVSQPLPEAPWFESGARRSARRVFLHIIAETSQHAGHADIIRESIDGAKTMG